MRFWRSNGKGPLAPMWGSLITYGGVEVLGSESALRASSTNPANAERRLDRKARKVLTESQRLTLAYYCNEYETGAMPVDAFVSVLLEQLDTPEKLLHGRFDERKIPQLSFIMSPFLIELAGYIEQVRFFKDELKCVPVSLENALGRQHAPLYWS
ncbi:hypothetical protein AVEN_126084-1 [Araneus ventricosus]|uniref:Uncharacterized protein n=1 Tax=Araneus ventricosus TaxID=182803 RepID=A0A4Y2CKH6_ARAVE|nr:hypothetical protein AVEN_126084-1 [Araneus ventricosus]